MTDERFDQQCGCLFAEFPCVAPAEICEEGWGDYEYARMIFDEIGSNWDCRSVFIGRSIINFVNDQAFLFLLPHFVRCSISNKGIVADVAQYLIFGLETKISVFHSLFTVEQRRVLLAALQLLSDRSSHELGEGNFFHEHLSQIIQKLADVRD